MNKVSGHFLLHFRQIVARHSRQRNDHLAKTTPKQTQEKIGEIAAWKLKEDPTLADYVDSDGLNPFQYAVSVGKKWIDDLDVGTKLGPGWTHVGVRLQSQDTPMMSWIHCLSCFQQMLI